MRLRFEILRICCARATKCVERNTNFFFLNGITLLFNFLLLLSNVQSRT